MRPSTSPVDIRPDHLGTVQDILRSHLPSGVEVWVFGSRANWTTTDSSDLDLAVAGPAKLDYQVIADLEIAFEESNLPYSIDVVDLNAVSPEFKGIVDSQKVPLLPAGDTGRDGWLYQPRFPGHWDRQPLFSLAQWVNGLAFRNIQFSATGMPVIKIAEIKNGITDQTKFTQQEFDESVRISPRDMLFSWSGQPESSIDVSWWHGPEGWLNQHIFRVTSGPIVDDEFFYYLLRYLKPNFVGIARNKQTTGLGHVTKRDLQEMEVAFPTLPEQRAIAHILGTLDDKIELNRRMNQTLEEMARAIYKDWFVDFGPVRARLEGTEPYLPPELWDLFPDRLVDSELGKIPEGWELKTLREVTNTVKGRSYKSSELADSETALVTLKSFQRGGGYRRDGLKAYVGDFKPEQVILPGEVVIACTDVTQAGEVIGHPALVEPSSKYKRLVASLDTVIVRTNSDEVGSEFLYFTCGTEAFIAHAAARSTGTTVLHLSKDAIPSFQIPLPPESIMRAFTKTVRPFLNHCFLNQQIVDNLVSQRDTLLPKLMSGAKESSDS